MRIGLVAIILFLFMLNQLTQAISPPPTGTQPSLIQTGAFDTTAIIPGMIAVLESGVRSVQARHQLDSLIELSSKIGFIPGVARGIMLTGIFYWENPDSALKYLRIARQYSKQQDYKFGFFLSTHNLGSLYLNYGVQDSSIYWLTRALMLWRPDMGLNRHAKLQIDIGAWYSAREDYKHSLEFLIPAMNTLKTTGDTLRLRSLYSTLGVMYTNLQSFEKAKSYYDQILAITPESFMNGRIWSDTYNNLGTLYLDVKKDQDSALIMFRKSQEVALKFKLSEKIRMIHSNMGSTFLMLRQQDSTIFYLLSAKSKIDKFTRKSHSAAIFISYGVAMINSGKIDSAKYYGEKGMALLNDQGTVNLKIIGYELLFQIDSVKGNYRSAIRYLGQAKELTKNLYNREILMKVAEKEFSYEMERKNDENRYLKKENELKAGIIKNQWYILGFAILIILLISVLLIFIANNRKKFQKLNNTKDKFLSVISHDLRSPFNSLLGLLDELHSGYDSFSDDERKHILMLLQSTSQNTYHLLENLLEWARSQQGQITSEPKIILLRQAVDKIIELLQARAEKKGIEIRNMIKPEMKAFADPILFDNCILNITNNAVKFTPAGGTITLTCHDTERSVFICCADTGIGIPPESLKQLFRLDGKVKRRGTANEPGTGLGLILCKEFIHLMKGKITLVSKENEGTKVFIELPAAHGVSSQVSHSAE